MKERFYKGIEKFSDISQKVEIGVFFLATFFGHMGTATLAAIGAIVDQVAKDWSKRKQQIYV